MIRAAVIVTLLCLLGCLAPPVAVAGGNFSGSVEMRYAEQKGIEAGHAVLDARHFAQQYSLLYQTEGKLYGGRLGNYDFSLGYEWNSLNSKLNDESFEIDTGKILYRGDVLLAPGGLPFRLHLYSHDLTRSAFVESGVGSLFEGGRNDEGPNAGRSLTNILNGQSIRSGITLVAGEARGNYRGKYRDLLESAPRLLIDYSEDYVRDLHSFTPQHYRSRNLAFVSLNKRDNWFHYRLFEHRDYLRPTENFEEKNYLIGTIDHVSQRQWINMTNWIQVSADGGYTTGSYPNVAEAAFNRYDLNLFARAKRTNWQASSFNTYSRVHELGTLEKTLEVPFFAQGDLSRETSWRFRFVGSREDRLAFASGIERDKDVLFGSLQTENFRNGQVRMTPQVAVEAKNGSEGEGYAARLGVEFYNNRVFRPRYDWLAGYSLSRFAGTGMRGLDTDFWEQNLRGKVETELTSSLRGGLEQEVIYGSGQLDRSVSQYINPRSDLGVPLDLGEVTQRNGSVIRSVTTWFAEHRTQRLSNRFELTYDYLSDEQGDADHARVSHGLRYDGRNISLATQSQLALGEQRQNGGNFGGTVLDAPLAGSTSNRSFVHSSRLFYSPGRAMEGSVRFNYEWLDLENGSADRWRLEQEYRYKIFKVNGLVSRLAEIGEKFELEEASSVGVASQRATVFTLLGNYYPTRFALLGARLKYTILDPEGTETLTWETSAGLDFEKFQVALDYAYGTRSEGTLAPARKEHRWELKVRKTF